MRVIYLKKPAEPGCSRRLGDNWMHVLHYDQLDITGFAGIRERVLVSDRQYFKRTAPDEVRDGFGACVYLKF